jgi:hypothetical protein
MLIVLASYGMTMDKELALYRLDSMVQTAFHVLLLDPKGKISDRRNLACMVVTTTQYRLQRKPFEVKPDWVASGGDYCMHQGIGVVPKDLRDTQTLPRRG